MKIKKYRYFVGDFETTVYEGQRETEVWASASVELFTDNVNIFHSINEQFDYFLSLDTNIIVYYHNLKFDGNFWLSFLLIEKKFKQAYKEYEDGRKEWLQEKEMLNNTFKYSISDNGQWYSIIIKCKRHIIEIRDSLKLLPFSVKRIGDSFGTKHKKLDMEYEGFRFAGCEITDEEEKYIANDVLVVKEALEIMFNEGHDSLTIGSCCLSEFKKCYDKQDYATLFPDLTLIECDFEKYPNADKYIRKSYRGGWCYLVKGKEDKIYTQGITLDVNSLYPSMMSSESGNHYPVGNPCFWKGEIPANALKPDRYYFVRIKTRFYIKEGKLPFIQIKDNLMYRGSEMLTTSDIYDYETDTYSPYYTDIYGNKVEAKVTLTLTCTDYELIKEHYDLIDCEILDGCWFYTQIGIFDEYINHYKAMKQNNKGAKRELAKLFLNNLYGKMASNDNSSFKIAYIKDDLSLGFDTVTEHNKKSGYIAIGSAITSYARNFTIRTAQKNYYGVGQRGFIYADTDSIHCDIPIDQVKGVNIHDKDFCCWKCESYWDKAIFTRQKTYIEHVTHEDEQQIEKPYYNIKCAGMPKRCKDLFEQSISDTEIKEEEYTQEELKFVKTKRSLEDFKIGLEVPSKLMPKRIKGGIILKSTTYKMRDIGC